MGNIPVHCSCGLVPIGRFIERILVKNRNHAYIPEYPGEFVDSLSPSESPVALSVILMSHRLYWKLVSQIGRTLNPALKSLTLPSVRQMLQKYPGVVPTFAWGSTPFEFQVMITNVTITPMRALVSFELCKFWEVRSSSPDDGTYFACEMLELILGGTSSKRRKKLEGILEVKHGALAGTIASETNLLVRQERSKGLVTSVVEPGFELEPVGPTVKTRIITKRPGKRLSASEAARASGELFGSHEQEPLGLPQPYKFFSKGRL